MDRIGQDVGQCHSAVLGQEVMPTHNRAWHSHRVRASVGDLGPAPGTQILQFECSRRSTAAVQGRDFLGCGIVEQGKTIAANPRRGWRRDVQHGGNRNGSVGGVASHSQYVETCLGREGVAGSDHSALGHDHRTPGFEVKRHRFHWYLCRP